MSFSIYNNLILTFILYFCRLYQYLTNIDLAEVNFSEVVFLSLASRSAGALRRQVSVQCKKSLRADRGT